MSMQQIMRWGHDFLRIRGWYLTFEPMGRSQVSIGEPIIYQPPFLVLFTNQLNSPRVSWVVIDLGLGRCGQPSILAGMSVFDHMHAQRRRSHSFVPHVEEDIRILHSHAGNNDFLIH